MNGGRRGEGVIGCNALTVDSFSLQLPFSLHLDCSISSVAAICIRSCSCARTLCCLLSARVLSVSPIRLFKPNNATVRKSSNSSKKRILNTISTSQPTRENDNIAFPFTRTFNIIRCFPANHLTPSHLVPSRQQSPSSPPPPPFCIPRPPIFPLPLSPSRRAATEKSPLTGPRSSGSVLCPIVTPLSHFPLD